MSERTTKKNSINWVHTGDVQVFWAKLLVLVRKLSLSSSHSITSWTNILAQISDIQTYTVFPICQRTATSLPKARKQETTCTLDDGILSCCFINSTIGDYSSHPDPQHSEGIMTDRCRQKLFGQEERRHKDDGKHLTEGGSEVQGWTIMSSVCTLNPPIEYHGVAMVYILKDMLKNSQDHAFNVLAIHCSWNYFKIQGAL